MDTLSMLSKLRLGFFATGPPVASGSVDDDADSGTAAASGAATRSPGFSCASNKVSAAARSSEAAASALAFSAASFLDLSSSSSSLRSAISSSMSSSSCSRNSSFLATCSLREDERLRSSVTETTTSSGRLARVSWISLSATDWRSSAAILSRSTAGSHATSPAPTGAGSSSATSGCIRSRVIVNALERMRSEGGSLRSRLRSSQSSSWRSRIARSSVSARIPRARFADLSSSSDSNAMPSCLMTRSSFFKLRSFCESWLRR
mmetsp:Transcript_12064/g.51953  ORF Transcript_12064/g.51953 Transcript_12064/m.51953 type:complete len:262 (-) Transcript_12064:1303-2088(-)